MNEPNKTADQVMPPQGRASVWWNVRPKLRVVLIAEVLAIIALLALDETSAAVIRSWFRPVVITVEQVHAIITALAIISLIAVIVEATRRGRFSSRRNEGMKVVSAQV